MATDPLEPSFEGLLTSSEHAAQLGKPTSTQHCPHCDRQRECQELHDVPDHPATAPTPYACGTCGFEFLVPKA